MSQTHFRMNLNKLKIRSYCCKIIAQFLTRMLHELISIKYTFLYKYVHFTVCPTSVFAGNAKLWRHKIRQRLCWRHRMGKQPINRKTFQTFEANRSQNLFSEVTAAAILDFVTTLKKSFSSNLEYKSRNYTGAIFLKKGHSQPLFLYFRLFYDTICN